MLVLKTENQSELIVKKSRFISIARKCTDICEIKKLVEETRALHPQANHVVHAAVVGNNFSFSDDKEPKNTAGRPALEVLKGSGISNICVLIVRYFGGTLLGTGGLVKAYSDSTKLILEKIETEELIEKVSFSFTIPYDLYDSTKRILSEMKADSIQEIFETQIEIKGKLPKELFQTFKSQLADLSNGKITVL